MGFVSKIYLVSEQEFRDVIAQSNTYSDCLRAFGLSTAGSSSRTALKRRIAELNCSIEHFGLRPTQQPSRTTMPLELILIENSTYTNRERLKQRLLRAGLLQYKCHECGLTKWRKKPISLQLEHKNGVNNDNRLENLVLLCPNCHSQTPTFAGRNTTATRQARLKKVVEPVSQSQQQDKRISEQQKQKNSKKPDKETLHNLLLTYSFVQVGKIYNVTDNAVRKWCKSYGLPHLSSQYKTHQ